MAFLKGHKINNGRKLSEEHKRKIGLAGLGRKMTEDNKMKLMSASIGKKLSDETKKKLSESMSGNKHPMFGKHHSEETKKKMSEAQIGEKNHNWNGGIVFNHEYIMVKVYSHPYATIKGYVAKHRLVMEEFLGRYLLPEEVVHHIDGDAKNNNIENLMLFSSHSEHVALHNKLNGKRDELIECLQ